VSTGAPVGDGAGAVGLTGLQAMSSQASNPTIAMYLFTVSSSRYADSYYFRLFHWRQLKLH